MYELDYEEDPGWVSSFIKWTSGLWTRWTAPDPEKIPFDPTILTARIELCLTRIKLLRRKQDAYIKQEVPELIKLAKSESPVAEVKVAEHLGRLKLFAVLDLLEPHLQLLRDSVNLPTHDMSPLLSVRTIIYAAPEVPRIEELALIRQQLVQKYNQVIAITKIELLEQELVQLLQSHPTTINVLQWLDQHAPKKCWAGKLEIALQADHRHPVAVEDQDSQISNDGDLFTAEGTQEIHQDAPDFSDDDNDDGDSGGFNAGALGNSHDSGPTDSPIPPLEAEEFPSVPNVPLYPVLVLSDSREAPKTSSAPVQTL